MKHLLIELVIYCLYFLDVLKLYSHLLPCIILEYDTQEGKEFLNSSDGILSKQYSENGVRSPIEFTLENINSLTDRSEGVALLSEVYCNSESGQFREYVRFFELAFSLPFTQLEKKLYEFLKPMPFGYTREEIQEWIELRHPSIHADMKKTEELAFTSDVRIFLMRMEQAALDVLFNKKIWCNNTVARRSSWKPDTFLTAKNGKIMVQQGKALSMLFRVYDDFGTYPRDLKASLTNIKENWYDKLCTEN